MHLSTLKRPLILGLLATSAVVALSGCSLFRGKDAGAFDLGVHRKCTTEAGRVAREFRLIDEQRFLDVRGRDNPSVA